MRPREAISPAALLQHGRNDHLIVVFSSAAVRVFDKFDYMNAFGERPEHVLYLRDRSPLAYHTGLTGLTNSIAETVAFLNYLSARLGIRRRTFFGTSSGGYAAILHAALCGADDVLAVNPTTFLSEDLARRLDCPSHFMLPLEEFSRHYAARGRPVAHDDLARTLRERQGAVRLVAVHYAAEDRRDAINAGHIADCPAVHSIAYATDDHSFLGVKLLKRGVYWHHFDTPTEALVRHHAARAGQPPLPT